jgi:hypothetical protein
MTGEWLTFCGECPMFASFDGEAGECAAGPETIELNLSLGRDPQLCCALPLRMAIRAGFKSVEELTEALAKARGET